VRPTIYWIPDVPTGRLAIVPRPRGGDWLEDEVTSLRLAGVDALVCLLTLDELRELDLVREAECCTAVGIQWISFAIPDRSVPDSAREARSVVKRLTKLLDEGQAVAIHCRQSVGRSALVAACVLTALGEAPEAAFESIARARGRPVLDTAEQRAWVKTFVTGTDSP
jgi:protein-tyrosine phosphatase